MTDICPTRRLPLTGIGSWLQPIRRPALLAAFVDPALLETPVNVLRVSLHPAGLAPHIANLAQWRRHLFERLDALITRTADEALVAMKAEFLCFPGGDADAANAPTISSNVFIPLVLNTPNGQLSFFSATTMFGTPSDITLAEIAIEQFFPADDATRAALAAGKG